MTNMIFFPFFFHPAILSVEQFFIFTSCQLTVMISYNNLNVPECALRHANLGSRKNGKGCLGITFVVRGVTVTICPAHQLRSEEKTVKKNDHRFKVFKTKKFWFLNGDIIQDRVRTEGGKGKASSSSIQILPGCRWPQQRNHPRCLPFPSIQI